MKSNVYMVNFRSRKQRENKLNKLKRLMDVDEFSGRIQKGDLTAVKLHFGERGNDTFINPVLVRQVVDSIKRWGARPFITDTNTLYRGSRHNSVDHLITAIEHGFDYAVVGAPLIIADGLKSQNFNQVEIARNHFKSVKIASDIAGSDSMVVLSHFKGHEMSGFGGAIKNLAMGCAPMEGKAEQHTPRPWVEEEACIGCGECIRVCPKDAVRIYSQKAVIDRDLCIGCGECMTVCGQKAITMDWDVELKVFIERMTEYACGAVTGKEDRILFINFLMNITPDCDCVPWSDAAIVPDIGVLASTDPVAVDMASVDLINAETGLKDTFLTGHFEPGQNKFSAMRDRPSGMIQITYGEEIGLGTSDYKLIRLD